MSRLVLRSILVLCVATGASACDNGGDIDELTGTDESALDIGLSPAGLAELNAADPNAAADTMVANSNDDGCKTRVKDATNPSVVHVYLDNCAGRFGRHTRSGEITVTFSTNPDGTLHADHQSVWLEIDGRPATRHASADITFDGNNRHVVWHIEKSVTTVEGEDVTRVADHVVDIDRQTLCSVVNGTATITRGDKVIHAILNNLTSCRTPDGGHECPTGSIVATVQRANRQFLAVKSTPQWKRWALVGAMAIGLTGIIWPSQRNESRSPKFEVLDVTNAVWHSETNASMSRVALKSGTAAFRVDRLHGGSRFLVEMPDGNIEVRGTRFVVHVADGQTHWVEVTEGLVWLNVPRFHGLLHAGERWPKVDANAAAPATSDQTNTLTPAQSETPAATSAPKGDAEAPSAPNRNASTELHANPVVPHAPSHALPAATNSAPMPKPDAGPRFAEAMQAFTAGDDRRADELFAAFVRDFPRDGRAEDATFLRAKARARRGDMEGASTVAREYLKAFPKGLRRPEAERLAGEAK